jgi:hypothetical protein
MLCLNIVWLCLSGLSLASCVWWGVVSQRAFRLYIAGAWPSRKLIKKIMLRAERLGFEITHDWTSAEGSELSACRARMTNLSSDYERSPEARRHFGRCAQVDLDGVKRADAVIACLYADYAYRGTFTEIGAALSLQRPVVILGPDRIEASTNVFYWHPDLRRRVELPSAAMTHASELRKNRFNWFCALATCSLIAAVWTFPLTAFVQD